MTAIFDLLRVLCFIAALAGCASIPALPLQPITTSELGGSWTLNKIGSRSISRAMTLNFGSEGQLRGSVRCNSLSGRYQIVGFKVVFPDDVIVTAAGCGGNWFADKASVEAAEAVVFGSPPSDVRLSADGRRLEFLGKRVARFNRQD